MKKPPSPVAVQAGKIEFLRTNSGKLRWRDLYRLHRHHHPCLRPKPSRVQRCNLLLAIRPVITDDCRPHRRHMRGDPLL